MNTRMMKNYKQILKALIRVVKGLSDPKYQEDIWVKGVGPDCSSFEEAVCYFFDLLEPMEGEIESYDISVEQWSALKCLSESLDAFCGKVPEIVNAKEEVLPNPEWHKIQKEAKEVYRLFQEGKKK